MVAAKGMSVARRSMGSGAGRVRKSWCWTRAASWRCSIVRPSWRLSGNAGPLSAGTIFWRAVWGKPVLFGPHTDHCAEVAALLLNAQGGRIVPDADALAQGLRDLLSDAATLNRMGKLRARWWRTIRGRYNAVQKSLPRCCRRNRSRRSVTAHCTWGARPPLVGTAMMSAHMQRWFRWAGYPYELAAKLRLSGYELGWCRTQRLPRPVISVGNLTVGGTGKTPVVMYIVERLAAQRQTGGYFEPRVSSSQHGSHVLVADGQRILVGPEDAGDEPYFDGASLPTGGGRGGSGPVCAGPVGAEPRAGGLFRVG